MVSRYKSGADVNIDRIVEDLRSAADDIEEKAPTYSVSIAEHVPAPEKEVKKKIAVVYTPLKE